MFSRAPKPVKLREEGRGAASRREYKFKPGGQKRLRSQNRGEHLLGKQQDGTRRRGVHMPQGENLNRALMILMMRV